jgi:hypothetical protein
MQHCHIIIQLYSAVSAVQKAKKPICQRATISDEPVVLLDLSIAIHTLQVEKKPLLSLLSIENLLPSEECGGDQQMMLELLNKAFIAKSTQYVQFRRHKEPYLRLTNEVRSR